MKMDDVKGKRSGIANCCGSRLTKDVIFANLMPDHVEIQLFIGIDLQFVNAVLSEDDHYPDEGGNRKITQSAPLC